MAMVVLMTDTAVPYPGGRLRFSWMFSRRIDLLFFFLPALLAPLVFLLSQSDVVVASALWAYIFTNAFGLGDFHVGVTWFNYLDSKNLGFYLSTTKKRVIYFVLPAVIIILSVLGLFYCPGFIVLVFIAWSIQHLVQQNMGLLLLYHNPGRGEAIVNRTIEGKSLQVTALFFSLLFTQRVLFPSLSQNAAWHFIVAAVGLSAVGLIIAYLAALLLQVRKGAELNLSAFLFWCLAIYFFVPFAFLGKSYSDAILIANIMHWAQYIGIMYVLVRRKYKDEKLNNLPWHYPILLFLLIGFSMIFIMGASRGLLIPYGATYGSFWYTKCLFGFVIGMSMVHYLQDAFMWRFREPFYRETVLSYLRSNL